MKPNDSLEVTVLEERRRALQTLIRYERDLDKLKVYKYELDLVTTELQRIEEALYKRPNGKIIPFPPKNHVRALISRVFRRQHPS